MQKTIRITEKTIRNMVDDETQEIFNDFIDRIVWGEVFAGRDPDKYELKALQLNLVIKVEVEE